MKKEDIVNKINEDYREYEGYVQFSHRPIEIAKDVFKDGTKVELQDESGFIYEAHFCNAYESIGIRQINDTWHMDTTPLIDLEENDMQIYDSIFKI